jgi:penicillin-binding protein 2
MINEDGWNRTLKRRLLLCALLAACVMLLLLLRLWQVQVLQGEEHLRATLRQSVRPIRLTPVRGRILAADMTELVGNRTCYDLCFHTTEMRRPGAFQKTIDYLLEQERLLAYLLKRPPALTEKTIRRHISHNPVLPLVIFRNLTPAELAVVAEITPPIPGLDVTSRLVRQYPLPGLATHLLGRTSWSRPDGEDLAEEYPRIYTSPQLVGRSGLESYYDQELSGRAGSRLIRVDVMGYDHEILTDFDTPHNGNDLILTIDPQAQKAAESVLQGRQGALVAVRAKTGAVIALASAPTFDLSVLDQRQYQQLSADQAGRPLFNRAVNGTYSPGSIVKPLLAMALLENEIVTEEDEYDCRGKITLGTHSIHCAKRYGHGPLNIVEAIKFSCNPFFMHYGMELGIDAWQPFLTAAGIGEKTGLDWPEARASAGIRPERDFATRKWKRKWLPVDMAYASIGQGAFTMTPLQAALYAAAIANGGILYQPFLVQTILAPDGNPLRHTSPTIRHRLPCSQETMDIIRHGMEEAVKAPQASAAALQDAGLPLAAKTGTAEVGSQENRRKQTWVICYGPVPEAEYAVACLVENGESGGKTVAPLLSQFFRLWLESH